MRRFCCVAPHSIVAIGLILILCGFLIRYKNAYWLIRAIIPCLKKKNLYIDTDKLARVMFVSCLLMGLSVIGGGVFFYFGLDVAGIIGIVSGFPDCSGHH
jgi:hypothetical protein